MLRQERARLADEVVEECRRAVQDRDILVAQQRPEALAAVERCPGHDDDGAADDASPLGL